MCLRTSESDAWPYLRSAVTKCPTLPTNHCRVGVTSEPDHSIMELGPTDKFIVLASDGVWEFISSKEAVDIISQYETAEESCRQVSGGAGGARQRG